MINRHITRTVKNSTETTAQTASLSSDTLAFNLATTDAFYIGFPYPFASRHIQVSTANTVASVLTVQYWDGTNWQAVDDLVDGTSTGGKTIAQSGFIAWQNKSDWFKDDLTGVDADIQMYWIKLTVSVNLSASTAIQSVVNLFSDDTLLRILYPELIIDSRYLPDSRTNFLEQHEVAKDQVVLRLKQRQLIDNEGQIIDINPVALAATHYCAFLILNPIATDDTTRQMRDDALKNFSQEIGQLRLAIDADKDGEVSEVERLEIGTQTLVLRR